MSAVEVWFLAGALGTATLVWMSRDSIDWSQVTLLTGMFAVVAFMGVSFLGGFVLAAYAAHEVMTSGPDGDV